MDNLKPLITKCFYQKNTGKLQILDFCTTENVDGL